MGIYKSKTVSRKKKAGRRKSAAPGSRPASAPKTETKSATPRLTVEYLEPDALVPYTNNPRTHTPEQVERIVRSITEFGYTNPILIAEGNELIAGHGRLEAAKAMGMERVPCIRLTGLTEAQRRAYLIADNRLPLDAGWNTAMLLAEIGELQQANYNVELTGFTAAELTVLLQGWKPDWDKLDGVDATGDGTRAVIRVLCDAGDKPGLLEVVRAAVEGATQFSNVVIE